MKKLILAALTAGALGLAFAPTTSDAAQLRVGVGPNGVGVGISEGHRRGWHHRRYHGPRCRMVKTWRHHRAVWVRRCW